MALEPKDFYTYLDLPESEVDSPEKLAEVFSKKFVKRDVQAIKGDSELFGQITGAYNEINKAALKKALKESGVDLTGEKLDEVNIREAIETILPKTFKKYGSEIETLKQGAAKGTNEKLTEIQSAFDNYKKEVEPKITGYEKLKGEYDTFKQAKEKEMKDFKIGGLESKSWEKFPWATGIDEFAKEGFQGRVRSKYSLDLSETGEMIVTDKQGNRVKNPAKADGYYSFDEVLEMEGKAANEKGARILAVAQKGPAQQMQQRRQEFQVTTPVNEPAAGRKINKGTRQAAA